MATTRKSYVRPSASGTVTFVRNISAHDSQAPSSYDKKPENTTAVSSPQVTYASVTDVAHVAASVDTVNRNIKRLESLFESSNLDRGDDVIRRKKLKRKPRRSRPQIQQEESSSDEDPFSSEDDSILDEDDDDASDQEPISVKKNKNRLHKKIMNQDQKKAYRIVQSKIKKLWKEISIPMKEEEISLGLVPHVNLENSPFKAGTVAKIRILQSLLAEREAFINTLQNVEKKSPETPHVKSDGIESSLEKRTESLEKAVKEVEDKQNKLASKQEVLVNEHVSLKDLMERLSLGLDRLHTGSSVSLRVPPSTRPTHLEEVPTEKFATEDDPTS